MLRQEQWRHWLTWPVPNLLPSCSYRRHVPQSNPTNLLPVLIQCRVAFTTIVRGSLRFLQLWKLSATLQRTRLRNSKNLCFVSHDLTIPWSNVVFVEKYLSSLSAERLHNFIASCESTRWPYTTICLWAAHREWDYREVTFLSKDLPSGTFGNLSRCWPKDLQSEKLLRSVNWKEALHMEIP